MTDAFHPITARLLGVTALESRYAQWQSAPSHAELFDAVLRELRITWRCADSDLARIPATGATVVVANHPTGMLDGIVLSAALERVRSDVMLLGNQALHRIAQLRDPVIPIDVDEESPSRNAAAVRRALAHLASGGLLIVFPAGEVAAFDWHTRRVREAQWQAGTARLVALAARMCANLAVIPAHVRARNSALFYAAGLLSPRLRSALLIRELLNKRGAEVDLRIGSAVSAARLRELGSEQQQIDYLQWRSAVLGHRETFKAHTSAYPRSSRAGHRVPVGPAISADLLAADVAALGEGSALASSGDLTAYIAEASRIPHVLAEIGRLREETFRQAGEGTGKATDLDRFDCEYLHLFVWHHARREVVGAYRLARTDEIVRARGIQGLYTATLFRFGATFLRELGPSLELGRSFVRVEYQRSFAPLLLLWRGIGAYVARNPRYRMLFGPVCISAAYSPPARQLMVAFLEKQAVLSGLMKLVQARNPWRRRNAPDLPQACQTVEELSAGVADLEAAPVGVPVLLRHYLKLGGRLLGFNVDPEFSNALDGLIVVDLAATPRPLLERYLGKAEAAQFLSCQKGNE